MNRKHLPLLILAAFALAACGNKGPLVLPQKPVPEVVPATPAGSVPVQEPVAPGTPPVPVPDQPPAADGTP